MYAEYSVVDVKNQLLTLSRHVPYKCGCTHLPLQTCTHKEKCDDHLEIDNPLMFSTLGETLSSTLSMYVSHSVELKPHDLFQFTLSYLMLSSLLS